MNNEISEKWQQRFNFFNTYGAPDSSEFKAAIKAQPMRVRLLYLINFWAFFFGPIYFVILGLWKKGLILLAISIGVSIVLNLLGGILPPFVFTAVGLMISLMWGMTANYAYYLKKVKGIDNWNPFAKIIPVWKKYLYFR